MFFGNSLIVVDFIVCATDDHGNSNFERIANAQKRCHCNRATRFDLLPMASREPKRNHVLLAVTAPLAKFLDSLPQSFEELDVVHHAGLLLLLDQKHHEQISCPFPSCRHLTLGGETCRFFLSIPSGQRQIDLVGAYFVPGRACPVCG